MATTTQQEQLRDDVDGPGRAARLRAAARSSRSSQDVKRRYHEVDSEAMQIIADVLGIHPVEVYSVASFYAFLHGAPEGAVRHPALRHALVRLRRQGRGRRRQLENELGVGFGETTDDGVFTLEWANCMGMCDQGPALLVNDEVYTRVTPETGARDRRRLPAPLGRRAKEGMEQCPTTIETQGNALTFATIEAEAGLKAALAMSPRRHHRHRRATRDLKGRGGAGFPTGMKWNFCRGGEGATRSTSSATPTRASPARSRTA